MKKFLDLFKIKKSKVVEELTKEFDKRLEAQKKANKKAAEDDAKESSSRSLNAWPQPLTRARVSSPDGEARA